MGTIHKKISNNDYRAKVGILGLNGAGKSSLMKIIAGVDDDFEGEVEFPGDPRVGYLEQVIHFFSHQDTKHQIRSPVLMKKRQSLKMYWMGCRKRGPRS